MRISPRMRRTVWPESAASKLMVSAAGEYFTASRSEMPVPPPRVPSSSSAVVVTTVPCATRGKNRLTGRTRRRMGCMRGWDLPTRAYFSSGWKVAREDLNGG